MMKMNNRGQSLVEAIIGFALISVIGAAFVGGMAQLRKTTAQTVQLSATDKQISDIAENVKAGVENYQVNFKYDEAPSVILDLEKLPMAWDVGRVAKREDCQECGGTYGYTIQPFEKFRGLYKVTLRMTHKSWNEPFRDYVFVVSAK